MTPHSDGVLNLTVDCVLQVCLTGHAWYDGSGTKASGASTGKQLQYIAFGAAVCEARTLCTTAAWPAALLS